MKVLKLQTRCMHRWCPRNTSNLESLCLFCSTGCRTLRSCEVTYQCPYNLLLGLKSTSDASWLKALPAGRVFARGFLSASVNGCKQIHTPKSLFKTHHTFYLKWCGKLHIKTANIRVSNYLWCSRCFGETSESEAICMYANRICGLWQSTLFVLCM